METALVIPAITGIVEALKQTGLPTRFAPLASVLLGVASHWLVPEISILTGILYGLGGVGLYSGVRASAGY